MSSVDAQVLARAAIAFPASGELAEATRELNRLMSKPPAPVAEGTTTTDDVNPLILARNRVNEKLDAAFTFVTGTLTSDQRATLTMFRSNQRWGVPVQYLCVNRTASEWEDLRAALAAKRATLRAGTPLLPAHAQVLAAAQTPDVAACAARIDASSGTLKAAILAAADAP